MTGLRWRQMGAVAGICVGALFAGCDWRNFASRAPSQQRAEPNEITIEIPIEEPGPDAFVPESLPPVRLHLPSTAPGAESAIYLNERQIPLRELGAEMRKVHEYDEQGDLRLMLSVSQDADAAAIRTVLEAVHGAGFKPPQFAFAIRDDFGKQDLQRIAQRLPEKLRVFVRGRILPVEENLLAEEMLAPDDSAITAETIESLTSPVEAVAPLAEPLGIGESPSLDIAPVDLGGLDLGGLGEGEMLGVGGTASGIAGRGDVSFDRLTQVILHSLEQRETHVVWLIDSSPSMKRQNQRTFQLLERLCRELELEKGLVTWSLLAFGEKTSFAVERPTKDSRELVDGLWRLALDESGRESTFAAVHEAAMRYQRLRAEKKNVLLFVVTDEAGDDQQGIEQALAACRRSGMRVYVLGPEAPLARNALDSTSEKSPLTVGPDSFAPEVLPLAYLDGRGDEAVASGFGPYSLSRLCRETGGLYFVFGGEDAYGTPLDAKTMSRYAPDYGSASQYAWLAKKSKARMALLEAVKRCAAGNPAMPTLRFGGEAEAIAAAVLESQRAAAKLDQLLGELNTLLEQGEADRQSETSPRWQAEFDLARGRVLAMQARLATLQLALAKGRADGKFADAKSDAWALIPAEAAAGGAEAEPAPRMQQAQEYLRRVVASHPGTPWAALAQRELDQPLGWTWQEVDSAGASRSP